MNQLHPILQYAVKSGISISIVFLFYQLILSKLTFYIPNRYYVLLGSAMSFLLPFLDLSRFLVPEMMDHNSYLNRLPSFDHVFYTSPLPKTLIQDNLATVPKTIYWDWQTFILIICISGMAVMLLKLVIQFISISRLKKESTVLMHHQAKIYDVPRQIVPFSFYKSIFVNSRLHSAVELDEIIQHEMAHIVQKHTGDILFLRLVLILQWWNPFAWFLNKATRQNLEFLADEFVLKKGADIKQYQYHLLKVSGISVNGLSNPFNYSSLKKRIVMINKHASSKRQLIRFLLILPLLVFLLLAFRNKPLRQDHRKTGVTGKEQMVSAYDESASAMPNVKKENRPSKNEKDFDKPDTIHHPTTFKEFQKAHPNVKNYITTWDTLGKIDSLLVFFKNGKKEVYNLRNAEELALAEQKYGQLFPLNPPVFPKLKEEDTTHLPLDYRMFLRENPEVRSAFWRDQNSRIIIELKKGMYESYHLDIPEQLNEAEQKYGKLPHPKFSIP